MSKFMRVCVPVFGLVVAAFGAGEAPSEPPSPVAMAARAGRMEALFPAEPVAPEVFVARLAAARKDGADEQLLLEAEVFRVLNHRIRVAEFDALATRLEKAADTWSAEKAVLIDAPELARALARLLLARKASLAGDNAAFRTFAAEAIWLVPNLQFLVEDLEAEARRDALVGNPDFAAFSRACDEGNEAAVKRFFARAYWADAPVSQELALEKLQAFRLAADKVVAVEPASAWRKPPRGVLAFGRARRATSPLVSQPLSPR